MLYTNADQLPNKMHELLINIGIFRPDVIMIIEVLSQNSVTITIKVSIEITGFELFPNIEDGENIRGLALYISNNLKVQQATLNTYYNENIWCTLPLKDNDNLLIGCTSRSLSTNNGNMLSLIIIIIYFI